MNNNFSSLSIVNYQLSTIICPLSKSKSIYLFNRAFCFRLLAFSPANSFLLNQFLNLQLTTYNLSLNLICNNRVPEERRHVNGFCSRVEADIGSASFLCPGVHQQMFGAIGIDMP